MFAVYSTFLQRAYDQILHDVALQNAHVIFAIDRAGIVGADGETHHGIFDLSFLSHIPNLTIMAPKDGNELKQMLNFAVYEMNSPVAIRYPRGNIEDSFSTDEDISLGKAEVLKVGTDISIIALGKTVKTALDVSKILACKNVSAEVINARFLKPLDSITILSSIRKTKRVITIEDNVIDGGLATAIKDLVTDEKNVTGDYFAYPDEFIIHGASDEIERIYGMDAESISKQIRF